MTNFIPEPEAQDRRDWASILKQFDESGLNVSDFCKQEKINRTSFYRNCSLRRRGADAGEPASFVPVTLDLGQLGAQMGDSLELTVTLPMGVTLHFRGRS